MLQKYTFILNIFLSQKLCIYLFNEKNILSNFLSVWVFFTNIHDSQDSRAGRKPIM